MFTLFFQDHFIRIIPVTCRCLRCFSRIILSGGSLLLRAFTLFFQDHFIRTIPVTSGIYVVFPGSSYQVFPCYFRCVRCFSRIVLSGGLLLLHVFTLFFQDHFIRTFSVTSCVYVVSQDRPIRCFPVTSGVYGFFPGSSYQVVYCYFMCLRCFSRIILSGGSLLLGGVLSMSSRFWNSYQLMVVYSCLFGITSGEHTSQNRAITSKLLLLL